jgi:hypothetical protein
VGEYQLNPSNTWAVVAGIENYAAGRKWELKGPANDACRFVRWLRGRGVPAGQILLFLSPLSAVADEPCVSPQAATRQAITDAFETVIHRASGDLLYIFWGGHGAIDDDRRILFTEDATEDNLRSVNLNQLLHALRTDFYPAFGHQAIFVDACANYLYRSQSRFVARPYEFTKGEPMSSCRQFSLYAAADGETARNDQTRRTGDFSDFVLNWLERNDPKQWPPRLDQLAEDVRRHFERRRLAKETHQTPLWIRHRSWQGDEDDLVGSQAEAGGRAKLMQEVRERLRQCEVTTDDWLIFYRQTIPYVDRELADAASRDQMIRNLALVNPKDQDYPKPALEFVWRAARALKDSDLEQWVAEKIGDRTLLKNLKERVANETPQPNLYLLIRLDIGGSKRRPFAKEFKWWVWSEAKNDSVESGSRGFNGTEQGMESGFVELLKEKLKKHAGRFRLEFFLPDAMLSLKVETWKHQRGAIGGIYPVAVRWANRPEYEEEWKNHVARIRRDKRRLASPKVQWLPDAQLPEHKIKAHFENSRDCCALIGFSTSPEAAEATLELLKAALECGAPFLFWSRETREGDFKTRFDKLVPQRHLDHFPECVRQLRQDDDDLSLVLLWDDPDRVPVKNGYSAQLLEN